MSDGQAGVGTPSQFTTPDDVTEEQLCYLYVKHVLASCNNNKSLAARRLGIDRRSLYRRLEKGSNVGQAALHQLQP